MGITACLIIGSMSGCSSKENGNSQSNQKEQTIQTNQTEEEISENEDVKNEEELQPTTVTVDYAEAFQSIQGCAVILNSENNTYRQSERPDSGGWRHARRIHLRRVGQFHGPGHPLSLYDWCQRGCMQRIVVHVGAAGTCQVQQYRPAGEV